MTTRKTAQPEPTSTAAEISALSAAYEAMDHLDLDALRRVLEWLQDRLIKDAKRRQDEAERRRYQDIEVPF